MGKTAHGHGNAGTGPVRAGPTASAEQTMISCPTSVSARRTTTGTRRAEGATSAARPPAASSHARPIESK